MPLTSIAIATAKSHRLVTLRHPNSFSCTVLRRRLQRQEADPVTGLPSEVGGDPTIGGMGVLRAEEEPSIEHDELGAAKCMFLGPFDPASLIEAGTAQVTPATREASIEAVAAPGAADHFEADSGDLAMVEVGPGVVITYEVVGLSSPIGIAPYQRKLLLNPRDDLAYLEAFDGL